MAEAAVTGAPAAAGGTSYGSPLYRGYVLSVLTLVYTLNFIDRNLISVIAQPIIQTFGLSDAEYGFLAGPPFALFYAAMGIPIAMIADRSNRVVVLALCIAIWSVMAALCGFAASFLFLLIARVGVAIGEAGGTPPSNSIIGDYFKPRSRANALGIFAMGVTLGGALSNFFGGPIAKNLNGPALQRLFEGWGWEWALQLTDWSKVEGWRVAFVVIGAPGILVALLLLLTVREPPRGYSDPPGTPKVESASMISTLKELLGRPTFWSMAVGASLTALVGYGVSGFQAPMAQRIHGIDAGTFALHFGGPLSLCAAAGTFGAGFLIEKISPKFQSAVAIVPAIGLILCVPLFIYAWYLPTSQLYSTALPIWCLGAALQYAYLGSQYTIGQGVVSARGRASAIAILLLMIALIGNGLGPLLVGWLSDFFMGNLVANDPNGAGLTADTCRLFVAGKPVADLTDIQKGVCTTTYGEGLRQSMVATALIFIPSGLFFALSAITLKKDMLAKTH